MLILAIETATAVGSLALLDGSTVLVEVRASAPMRHLEWLAPSIEQVLIDQHVTPAAVEALAVSQGPGTFMGLRIGIATAVAWAHARSIPVVGVPTLAALAIGVQHRGVICPILDVRRGEVAAALFAREEVLTRRLEDMVGSLEHVLAALPAEGSVTFAGDALERYETVLRQLWGSRAIVAPRDQWAPRAAAVGQLGALRLAMGERDDPMTLVPIYPRPAAVVQGSPRVP